MWCFRIHHSFTGKDPGGGRCQVFALYAYLVWNDFIYYLMILAFSCAVHPILIPMKVDTFLSFCVPNGFRFENNLVHWIFVYELISENSPSCWFWPKTTDCISLF